MRYFLGLIFFLFFILSSFTQNNSSKRSFSSEEVIDEIYGITMYEPLNVMLGGDTVRNTTEGYACNGFVEDYYSNGKLLHKGFYVEGKLKVYKNYYPNGQAERNFRMIDLKKSKMTLFYDNGIIKSSVTYLNNEALKWEDYYPDGKLEFVEEYDKSMEYYIFKANYYEDGTPEEELELLHKKKLRYTQKYYYSNGQVKEEGVMEYVRYKYDYQKTGSWSLFDKNGTLTKTRKYLDGKLVSEKGH